MKKILSSILCVVFLFGMSTIFAQSASAAPARRAVSFVGNYFWDGRQWKKTDNLSYNYYCGTDARRLKIPADVTLTDGSDLKNFSTLVVPKNVKAIGSIVSDRLKSLNIGTANILYARSGEIPIWLQLPNLKTITASKQNRYFSVKKGALYNKRGTTLHYYSPARTGSYLKVEKSCRVIDRLAFDGSKYLKKIVVPSGVKEVREAMFERGRNIREIVFEGPVKFAYLFYHGISSSQRLTRIVLNHKNATFTLPVGNEWMGEEILRDSINTYRREFKNVTIYVKPDSQALKDVQEIGLKYQIIA